jgi:O-6-methylguanine DNA methyltransferase
MKTTIYYSTIETPIGLLYVGATDKGLCVITWNASTWENYIKEMEDDYDAGFVRDDKKLNKVKQELKEYFDGNLKEFTVDLDLFTMTPFQEKVLRETFKIPYGAVKSYKGLAVASGSPKGYRAVGNTMGDNPIPIIIPCHRVLKSDGSLGGYGGGINIKSFLLQLEGVMKKRLVLSE